MLFQNPNSKRQNPLRKIYDNPKFRNVLKHRDDVPDFPYIVDVEITNWCNLQCIFCGQQAMTREKGFMSMKLLSKLADECAKHKTPMRFIGWGEPFMHPKIMEFCKYAKSKGVVIHISNNGLAIKPRQIQELVDLQVDSIIFSFQGATKEQYQIMRNNTRYDDLKKNILKLVELRGDKEKPFIHITTTITNETKEEVDSFVKYWGNIVDYVGVGITNLSYIPIESIKSAAVVKKLESLKPQETIKKCYIPCVEVYQKLTVNWDGKVSCCCNDYDNLLNVGDLNKSSISDIWNNSVELKCFRGLLDRNMHASLTACRNCYRPYGKHGF
ncbi:radical SAM protein [Candidatus Woesearchaeota archaeon]|nr:radical SAM protein [Candidatus Woesearchaeota archaeon]